MCRNWRNKLSLFDGSLVEDDGDDKAADVVSDFKGDAPSRLTAVTSFFGDGDTPPVLVAAAYQKHTPL